MLLLFQTMNGVRSNNLSLEYQGFTAPVVCKEKGIRTNEFVAKTQFLWVFFGILVLRSL